MRIQLVCLLGTWLLSTVTVSADDTAGEITWIKELQNSAESTIDAANEMRDRARGEKGPDASRTTTIQVLGTDVSTTLDQAPQQPVIPTKGAKGAQTSTQPTPTSESWRQDFGFEAATSAQELETRVYTGAPINIILIRGQERRIQFDTQVSVWVPGELQQILNVQVYGVNTLLMGRVATTGRIVVRDNNTGDTMPINVSIIEEDTSIPALNPIYIATSATATAGGHSGEVQSGSDGGAANVPSEVLNLNPTTDDTPNHVVLTRWAAQHFYGPERLLEPAVNIQSVKLDDVKKSLPLYRGGYIKMIPRAAWKRKGLYVIAFEVRNTLRDSAELDPRNIRGQWQTATFQHNTLGGKYTSRSTTMAYLTSTIPIEQTLNLARNGKNGG